MGSACQESSSCQGYERRGQKAELISSGLRQTNQTYLRHEGSQEPKERELSGSHVIPAFRKLRQDNLFEARLGCEKTLSQ